MNNFRTYVQKIGVLPTIAHYMLETFHQKAQIVGPTIGIALTIITNLAYREKISGYAASPSFSKTVKYPILIVDGCVAILSITAGIIVALTLKYLGAYPLRITAGKLAICDRERLDAMFKSKKFQGIDLIFKAFQRHQKLADPQSSLLDSFLDTKYTQDAYKELLPLLSIKEASDLNKLWVAILKNKNDNLEKAARELFLFPHIDKEVENLDQIQEIFSELEKRSQDLKPESQKYVVDLIKRSQKYSDGALTALNRIIRKKAQNLPHTYPFLSYYLKEISTNLKTLEELLEGHLDDCVEPERINRTLESIKQQLATQNIESLSAGLSKLKKFSIENYKKILESQLIKTEISTSNRLVGLLVNNVENTNFIEAYKSMFKPPILTAVNQEFTRALFSQLESMLDEDRKDAVDSLIVYLGKAYIVECLNKEDNTCYPALRNLLNK